MGLGLIAQVSDLLADNTAQQRETQIGTHRLGNRNPVVARCSFHRLVALVDDHRNRLIVRRIDFMAERIV